MFKQIIPNRVYLVLVFLPILLLAFFQCLVVALRAFIDEMFDIYEMASEHYCRHWNPAAKQEVEKDDQDFWNHH